MKYYDKLICLLSLKNMYKLKTFNNIADDGLNILHESNFIVTNDNPDAIVLRSELLKPESINSDLLCIARAGAGVNNIPIKEATKAGIVVFNTPGANANAVKELVLCGMLLSTRGILQGYNFLNSIDAKDSNELNKLVESNKKQFKGFELAGKTLGIIGLGAIGSLVAQSAHNLGMNLIGFDPFISIDSAWRLPKEVLKSDSIEELVGRADFVSIHVPLLDDTKEMINKNILKHFKKGSKLINLSRGPITKNNDVIDALKDGIIDRFVTDFPTQELINRSKEFGDVILLPHLGASTSEAEVNCAVMAANQTKDFILNGNILNSVNFPRIRLGRSTDYRLVVINKNEPGLIGKIADCLASHELNISDMVNKSRDEIAKNLIDLDTKPNIPIEQEIKKIEHILSVRSC